VEDETVLTQMFAATKAGGGIVVTVPQHPFLWSASDEFARHQRRYRREELREKVERAGFRVERLTSFVSLLFPLMFAARRKSRIGDNFDFWKEFRISPWWNKVFEGALAFERRLIEAGVSFPVGGSLLLVGRKPVTS
jgi:hypothetical protein